MAVVYFERSITEMNVPTAADVCGAAAVVTLESEPAPRLIVDSPLPGPLSFGRVVIQYRTENLRILPVYGPGAMGVSPRLGHLHLTIDDASWHWLDASGEAITLNGFTPGKHRILFELSDPMHNIILRKAIEFEIPEYKTSS